MESPTPCGIAQAGAVRRARWGRRGRPPGGRTRRAASRAASLIVLTAVCSGCMPWTSRGPPSGAHTTGQHAAVITVGSFDFPESVLLADIYGDALKAKGFPVRILPDLGSRELVDPALMNGLIQLVPEYAGSALQFISLGRQSATSDVMATNQALTELMADRGIVAGLRPPRRTPTPSSSAQRPRTVMACDRSPTWLGWRRGWRWAVRPNAPGAPIACRG
jgi:Substrate binding domain of ABC-type glycine betaine transport system